MCTLVFGSWSYTETYINYNIKESIKAIDHETYHENSQWALVDFKGFRNEIFYDNWVEKDAFSEIHYKILIRRKPFYMVQNYCLPAIMMCTVLLYIFYVPFAQGKT